MNGETHQCKVTITNPNGFHMRPAATFAELAGQFQSSIIVFKDKDQRINGKNIMELLLLAAEPGTELTLEVAGPDASAAMQVLAQLLAAPSVDDFLKERQMAEG